MKWLLWKEWRENRLVPLWIALLTPLAIVAFRLAGVIKSRSDAEPFLIVAWVLAAIFAGAGLIAREVGGETLQFLTAHPISRMRIWWIKLGAGAAVLLASGALSTATWLGARDLMLGSANAGNSAADGNWMTGVPLILCGAAVCFALSLAASSLLDRTISAAMVAVVGGFVLYIPIAMLACTYKVFVGSDSNEGYTIVLIAVLMIPGLLASSFGAFIGGESMRTRQRFFWAAIGGALGLAAAWIPAAAGLAWHARFNPQNNWQDAVASPTRNLVGVRDNDGSSIRNPMDMRYNPPSGKANKRDQLRLVPPDHLVVVDTHTGRRRVLPGGDIVAWSADDRLLIWCPDVTPWLGLTAGWHGLGSVCLDTRTNRQYPLGEEAWKEPKVGIFSPDGRWFAGVSDQARNGFNGMGASIYRSEEIISGLPPVVTTSPLIGQPGDRVVVGWMNGSLADSFCWGGDSHYLYGTDSYTDAETPLRAFDPASGRPGSFSPSHDGTLTLCTINSHDGRLELEMSANPHRVLALLHPLEDQPASARRQMTARVIDLDAATRDAKRDNAMTLAQQDSNRIPPVPLAVDAWMEHYAVAHVPCTGGSAPVISPDGRVVLTRSEKQSTTLSAIDLDHSKVAPKTLKDATLPGKDDWEPGGHRFLTRAAGCSTPRVVDPVAGTTRLIPDPRKNGLWLWHAVAIAPGGEVITSSAPSEHEFPAFTRVEMPAR